MLIISLINLSIVLIKELLELSLLLSYTNIEKRWLKKFVFAWYLYHLFLFTLYTEISKLLAISNSDNNVVLAGMALLRS